MIITLAIRAAIFVRIYKNVCLAPSAGQTFLFIEN